MAPGVVLMPCSQELPEGSSGSTSSSISCSLPETRP